MKSASLVFLAFFLATGFAHGESALVIPASATELLGVLPATPENWKLVESKSVEGFDRWLHTRAHRIYQPLTAAATPAGSTAAPLPAQGSVEISVTDTGGAQGFFTDFADFKPGKNGPLERLFLAGQPALVITASPEEAITQIAAGQRFLIEITIKGLPAIKAEDWLRLLKFNTLSPTATGQPKLPASVRRVSIDELNPAHNRTSAVPGETVNAALRAADGKP